MPLKTQMDLVDELEQKVHKNIKEKEMEAIKVEIMLCINEKLFQRGSIPEEMYRLAKEKILQA